MIVAESATPEANGVPKEPPPAADINGRNVGLVDFEIADRAMRIAGRTSGIADRTMRIAGRTSGIADRAMRIAYRTSGLTDRTLEIADKFPRIAD